MFHNSNGLFYSKQTANNQIELIQIDVRDNNKQSKPNRNQLVISPSDDKSSLLKYAFFNEALLIIQHNQLRFYKNYKNKQSIITSPYNFKEEHIKVKLNEITPQRLYIVSFGKVIHLIRILNNNRMTIQTYRVQFIAIHSIISSAIMRDFTGENVEITCRVAYDLNTPSSFAIQRFILPFLESEIIINHQLFFCQSDPFSVVKLWAIDSQIVIVSSKNDKKFITTLSNHENTVKKAELIELTNCSIDQIVLLPESNHIIVFCDNSKVFIYFWKSEADIAFIKKLDYNCEGKFLLKHKAMIVKDKVCITAFNTLNQLKLITMNKDFSAIDKEEYIMTDYSFSSINAHIVKSLNREIEIRVIKGKHCEVMNKFFYNAIIQSVKCIEGVTVLVYPSKIEIFFEKDISQPPITIISYAGPAINVLDYDLCFVKERLFFFVLFIDNSTERSLLVLFQYNCNDKAPFPLPFAESKRLLFNYAKSDQVRAQTLLDTSKTLSYISLLKEYYLLVLISPYGELQFYSYDENGSIALMYTFTFSFHNSEITEMKNEFENESDLNNLFSLDRKIHVLSSYSFIDAFVYKEPLRNIPIDLSLFIENYIIIVTNCGIIVFQTIRNSYTGVRKIFFREQISSEMRVDSSTGFKRDQLRYDPQTKKFGLK